MTTNKVNLFNVFTGKVGGDAKLHAPAAHTSNGHDEPLA
jgi:hypothetical protein